MIEIRRTILSSIITYLPRLPMSRAVNSDESFTLKEISPKCHDDSDFALPHESTHGPHLAMPHLALDSLNTGGNSYASFSN